LDTKQINAAKEFIKQAWINHMISPINCCDKDQHDLDFIFEMFVEGRKQALEEIEAIAKKRWEERYARYTETMNLAAEEELEKELAEDADTMTIKEVIDCNHRAWQNLDSVLAVLLRKIAVQAEERKRSTK